jgi:transcriptional regulator with XRE-family HTH domain
MPPSPPMSQDMPDPNLRHTIGANARKARLRLELTQEDVAERLGLSTEVYGRLERGGMAPSVHTLRKLCLALNLQADVALGISDVAPPGGAEPPPHEPKPRSKHLQRILRRARKLTPQSQRLVAQLTDALPKKSPSKPKPPRK